MDWDDLRYFLAIHRTGTLAGAARALDVEHTTVGRRLAALERDLGAKLFVRTPDGLTPTAAGASLLPDAVQIEQAAEAALRRVKGHDARVEGTVRLTTSEAFAGFLVKRLGPLRAHHPGLLVEILASNRPLDLARGEADVALRMARSTQPELISRRVADTGWSLYAAEGYLARRPAPASPDVLTGHEVVAFEASLERVPGAVWLGDGRGARIALRANSLLAALNATIGGLGVGVLPCILGDPEGTLRRLTPSIIASCEAFLVAHQDLVEVARVRIVMDHLIDVMAREAAVLRGA